MTRPSLIQWVIIWTAVLVALHIWLHLRLDYFTNDGYGGWGLPGYLRPLFYETNRGKAPFAILLVGGLLAWQASGWRKR